MAASRLPHVARSILGLARVRVASPERPDPLELSEYTPKVLAEQHRGSFLVDLFISQQEPHALRDVLGPLVVLVVDLDVRHEVVLLVEIIESILALILGGAVFVDDLFVLFAVVSSHVDDEELIVDLVANLGKVSEILDTLSVSL